MTVQFDRATLSKLSVRDLKVLIWRQRWLNTARQKQLPPNISDHGNGIDQDWTEWGLLSGRNFGKTLCGSHWLGHEAITDSGPKENNLSFVIAPTLSDVRYTCFEGPTGLITTMPQEVIADYNRTNLIITLDNGGIIRGFSAEEPERLRGPQAARAWCFPGETLVRMADGAERRIDGIIPGDMVATRLGNRRVVASGTSGNKRPLVEIEFGGMKLTATEDHPILVNGAWKAVGEIKVGDELCVIVASSGAGKPGTSTETTKARTTSGLTRSAIQRLLDFIEKSGLQSEAPSRRATTSITRITTKPTTTSRIWSVFRTVSTCRITALGDQRALASVKSSAEALLRCGLWPRNANSPAAGAGKRFFPAHGGRTLGHSAHRSVRISGAQLAFHPSIGPATIAERLTPQSSAFNATAVNLAMPLPLQSALHLPLRFVMSFAPTARRSFGVGDQTRGSASTTAPLRFTTSIVSRTRTLPTLRPVCDLTVEGAHEFIANGVVVHNCDELAAWGGTGGGGERVADETWNMMMFGLRLGPRPRIIWTTTPKPKELVRRLSKPKPRRHITTGSSDENRANTPDSYFEQLDQYAGTRLERQERFGEIIDDEEGAIISKSWLRLWPAKKTLPKFDYIVASFDTAFTDASLDVRSHVPDPTACGVFGAFWNPETQREEVLVLDVWDEHLGFPDLLPKAKQVMKQGYGDDHDLPMLKPMFGPGRATQGHGLGRKPDIMLVEDKGSGISMRQMLEREGIPLYPYNPGNADKAARLHMVSHIFSQRMVWVPESTVNPGQFATWADPETKKDGRTGWLTQIVTFKGKNSVRFDDYVDVTAQALRLLIEKQIVTGIKQSKDERDKDRDREENPPPRARGNPYAQ